MIAKIVIIFT